MIVDTIGVVAAEAAAEERAVDAVDVADTAEAVEVVGDAAATAGDNSVIRGNLQKAEISERESR